MRVIHVFVLIFFVMSSLAWAGYPNAKDEYINDFAQIIDNSRQTEIRAKLYEVEYYSGVEISVVTVDSFHSFGTGAASWEAFSTGLFNYWGVGNKHLNNGVLLIVSKDDRKIRIELGAGFPSHYDSIMEKIIDDSIAPQLRTGNYTNGIELGVDEIIKATTVKVSFFTWHKWHILGGIGALISLLIALLIDRSKNPGLFLMLLAFVGYIILYILRHLKSGNRSEGFGGGSSRGGGASGDF